MRGDRNSAAPHSPSAPSNNDETLPEARVCLSAVEACLVRVFRFIALIWNPLVTQSSATVQSVAECLRDQRLYWHEAKGWAGCLVFHRDSRAGALDLRVLPEEAGVVAGVIFERNRDETDDSPARPLTMAEAPSEAIVASRGRWLIDNCWGNYVAIIRDRATSAAWVMKDPTGELPCLITQYRDVSVVFSCVTDLIEMGLFQFSVRQSYLVNRVLGGSAGEGALENVRQVDRGECIDAGHPSQHVERRFHWHPSSFAESANRIEDPAWAARAMRAMVRSCTHSWASLHDSILHRLSGGLDSSIIAACLKDAPNQPRRCSYTYYVPQGRSDERYWARLAAQQGGTEHVECPIRPQDIRLELALNMPLTPEPMPVLGYWLRRILEHSLVSERNSSAVFCGDGGDSGFGSEAVAHALSDYLRQHGLRGEAFRLAGQIALLTEKSSWSVFGRAIRHALFGESMQRYQRLFIAGSRLLAPQLRGRYKAMTRFPHPWFADRRQVPWGTVRRLGMLLAAPRFYDVASSEQMPEVVAPLNSQPAIELFLRIPLYRHFENGRERGLARRAFAGDVSPEILQRQWKDRAPGFDEEVIRLNRNFLRELMLDGVLVRNGLLDRPALEQALSDRLSRDAVIPGEIFRHLEVEIWARNWAGA